MPWRQTFGFTVNPATPDEEGAFRLSEINPERYALEVQNLPEEFYVKSARSGDVDALENGIDLTRGAPAPLQIVVAGTAAAVAGSVKNSDGVAVAEAIVALVPQEGARQKQPPFYRSSKTDASGNFRLTGLIPGPVLSWVAAVQQAVGLEPVNYSLGGVVDPRGGLDMIWLVGVLMAGFGVGALVFFGFGGKSRRVHQLDNYAGGHFLTAEVRYQYSDNFYAGLMHLIGPWYRGAFLWLEGAVRALVDFLSYGMNWVYRSIQPLLFLLATTVAMLAWAAV